MKPVNVYVATFCLSVCQCVRVCCSVFVSNVPKKVQRRIKSQPISAAAPYRIHPSTLPASCTEVDWPLGDNGGGEGASDHNYSWVMNCEMQQKPPLLPEGFWAHSAIEEERRLKCVHQIDHTVRGTKKEVPVFQKSDWDGHLVGSYYPVSAPSI